jgi:hypothetical protein
MGTLLGGNDDAKKAAEEARRAQAIANDRQLATQAAQEGKTGATRRNPRGRRLFAANAAEKGTLA